MSEHQWAQNGIAAYVAGGLESAERERLETHLAECPECARSMSETRTLDQQLVSLFAHAQPGPALEDRLMHVMQTLPVPRRKTLFGLSGRAKILLSAAAVLLLALVGLSVNTVFDDRQNQLFFLANGGASSKKQAETAVRGMGTRSGGELLTYDAQNDASQRKDAPAFKRDVQASSPAKTNVESTSLVPSNSYAARGDALAPKETSGSAQRLQGSLPSSPAAEKDGKAGSRWYEDLAKQDPSASYYWSRAKKQSSPESVSPAQLPPRPDNKPPQGEGDGDAQSGKGDAQKDKSQADKSAAKNASAERNLQKDSQPKPPPEAPLRKVIYTAELEFEVDSFDDAVAIIMQLNSATKGSFLGTINQDKLPNGKMRGVVVLRIPPDLLTDLIGKLIKELTKKGELKNQHLDSSDVTKLYTDLESRLKAARSMEERLIGIIKEGKGVIKDLLQAEKELGVWRTKIEEFEGELRYYANLVAHSTLTIKLSERDIRNPAHVTENERIQAGIETEEVEKAFNDLKTLVQKKGTVTRSELNRVSANQFNAILHFEVPPELTDEIRDRLRQLGYEARLKIDTVRQADEANMLSKASTGAKASTLSKTSKVTRGPTQFLVSIYNLANMIPRETIIVRVAATDVPKEFRNLRREVEAGKGQIAKAELNEQDRDDISAQLDFDIRKAHMPKIEAALLGSGETLDRKGVLFPERDDVTESKVRFLVTLKDADSLKPRETRMLRIVANDVPASFDKLRKELAAANVKMRVFVEHINKLDAHKISANFDFSYYRSQDAAVIAALAAAGDNLSSNVTHLPAGNNVTDAKVLARVLLISADVIKPRETYLLKIATADVAKTYQELQKLAAVNKVRKLKSNLDKGPPESRAELSFEVPSDMAGDMQTQLETVGEIVARNRQRAPDTDDVTDAKVLYQIEVVTAANNIPPRETTKLLLEVSNVATTLVEFDMLVKQAQGQSSKPKWSGGSPPRVDVEYTVPLAVAPALLAKFREGHIERVYEPTVDPQAPDGKLALARFIVTLSSSSLLSREDSLTAQLRQGMSISLKGLFLSFSLVLAGLMFVGPWLPVAFVVYLVAWRSWRSDNASAPPVAPAPPQHPPSVT